MSAFKLVSLAMLIAVSALSSAASTVHTVRFAQPETVLVWEDGILRGQGDTIRLSGFGASASADILGSGDLLASDSPTSQTKTVSIASNTGFVIRSGDEIAAESVSVRMIGTGANAQAREARSVADPKIVFQQSEKTAIRPGSPETQSITLQIEWTGAVAPNLYVTTL